MQKKILSDQSLEELKYTRKKQYSIIRLQIILLCILVGASTYLTITNGFSFFTVLPLFFFPICLYSLFNQKKIKDEIKIRTAYIVMENKIKEMK